MSFRKVKYLKESIEILEKIRSHYGIKDDIKNQLGEPVLPFCHFLINFKNKNTGKIEKVRSELKIHAGFNEDCEENEIQIVVFVKTELLIRISLFEPDKNLYIDRIIKILDQLITTKGINIIEKYANMSEPINRPSIVTGDIYKEININSDSLEIIPNLTEKDFDFLEKHGFLSGRSYY